MDHVAGIGSPQRPCKAVAGYVAKGSEGQLRKQGRNSSGADPTHRRIKKMLSEGLRSHSPWGSFTTPGRTAKKSDFAKRTKRLEEKTPDQLTDEQAFPAALRGVLIVKDDVCVKCNHDAANWRCLHLYYARRYDQAVEKCQQVLELDPDFFHARGNLADTYAAKGLYDRAFDEYQKTASIARETSSRLAALREAFRQGGIRDFWRTELELSETSTSLTPDATAIAAL